MKWLVYLFDLFLHLDRHLSIIIERYGAWTYILLFAVIFCETGLVVTPFLPGDSLLFAAGAFAGLGSLNAWLLYGLLLSAAILGDSVNYIVGRELGVKLLQPKYSRWVKPEYVARAQMFYDKYGAKTIVLARFVPIVRTFAPFVAGLSKMNYQRFVTYNILGGVLWVSLFVWAGYFFGNLPAVKHNFSYVIFAIIGISLVPVLREMWLARKCEK